MFLTSLVVAPQKIEMKNYEDLRNQLTYTAHPLVSHYWLYWKARAVESKAFHAARQETLDSCKRCLYGEKVR